MKKLKMIVTSVIVLAIVGSAFAFSAKKNWTYCTSGGTSTTCNTVSSIGLKRVLVNPIPNVYYVPCWEGSPCSTAPAETHVCTVSAQFTID